MISTDNSEFSEMVAGQPRWRLSLLLSVVLALAAVSAAATGCGNADDRRQPNESVATIAGAHGDAGVVTTAEFQRALDHAAAETGVGRAPEEGDPEYEQLKDTAMGILIGAVWTVEEARRRQVSATKREIAAEISRFKSKRGVEDLRGFLETANYSRKEFQERIAVDILFRKMLDRAAGRPSAPTAAEVRDFYEEELAERFTRPAVRDIRIIVADHAEILKARSALEADSSASSWRRVAQGFSEDPLTKGDGGLRRGLPEGEAEEPLNSAIFDAPTGRLVGPVGGAGGRDYVFEVEKAVPAKATPLAKVRDRVIRMAKRRARRISDRDFIDGFYARWRPRTVCASGYTTERCANFGPMAQGKA